MDRDRSRLLVIPDDEDAALRDPVRVERFPTRVKIRPVFDAPAIETVAAPCTS
jgi:hypothetical protein